MTAELMDRTPPNALDAEQAILGAMMLAEVAVRDARDVLSGGDFYRLAHEWVFDAICALDDRREPHDPIAVAAELGRRGQLVQAGGPVALAEMVSAVAVTGDVPWLAALVRDKAESRRLIDKAHKALQLGYDQTVPAIDRLELARSLFDDTNARSGVQRFDDVMTDVLDDLDKGTAPGLPTPWPDLDRLMYGLQPGKLYVVGARPGVGKSLFSQGLAAGVDRVGKATYYASLEMTTQELTKRALASAASVRLGSIVRRQLDDQEWERIAPASDQLRNSLIHIEDCEQTIAQIRAGARSLSRRHRLGLVAIDYLQLVTPRDRRAPREQQVAEISRETKLMAKALHVPVVLLAQLNRKVEERADKKPLLSDLRESGAIEQDADVVLLLHTPDDDDYKLEVAVAKNREGQTGSVSLLRQGSFARLRPYASERTPA